MGARRDCLNQALLDRCRSVYRGTIQPGCYQRWWKFAVTAYGAAMCEQGVQLVASTNPYLLNMPPKLLTDVVIAISIFK